MLLWKSINGLLHPTDQAAALLPANALIPPEATVRVDQLDTLRALALGPPPRVRLPPREQKPGQRKNTDCLANQRPRWDKDGRCDARGHDCSAIPRGDVHWPRHRQKPATPNSLGSSLPPRHRAASESTLEGCEWLL
ncbi:hypothetical protein KM043_013412 [Ampulex compressa]|nr:hypothetical protein KM043_013412 [Ampulex compressa]